MLRRWVSDRRSVRAQGRVLRLVPTGEAGESGERTYKVVLLVQGHSFDPFEATTTVCVPTHKPLTTGQEVVVRVGRTDKSVQIVTRELRSHGPAGGVA